MISKKAVETRLLNQEIIVKTFLDKKGKYGRLIGMIIHKGVNISDWLVEQGLAVYKDY